jgi:hypothetical protein
MRAFITPSRLFPGSSAVEQPAVNRLVAGSNPARGAKSNQRLNSTIALAKITKNRLGATYGATIYRFRGRCVMPSPSPLPAALVG